MKRILIVKTGKSETFAEPTSSTPSYGDVLRSTVILHPFKNDHVTWVTSTEALPLLRRNPFVSHLVTDEEVTPTYFSQADIVVNLEREARWLECTNASTAPEKFGYGGNLRSSTLHLDPVTTQTWQERLFALLGLQWSGEPYIYVPPRISTENFDIGLNWSVGPKWPSKAWPIENWQRLFQRFAGNYSVSWQQGFNSLDAYAGWIASCNTIVTCDTLGLHLALALKKKVVALFGPTPAHEIPLYGQGIALSPDPRGEQIRPPMAELSVTSVETALLEVLSKTKQIHRSENTVETHP